MGRKCAPDCWWRGSLRKGGIYRAANRRLEVKTRGGRVRRMAALAWAGPFPRLGGGGNRQLWSGGCGVGKIQLETSEIAEKNRFSSINAPPLIKSYQ